MRIRSDTNRIPALYPLQTERDLTEAGLVGPALQQIATAWRALDELERTLPGGPDRWQADSLFVAREGLRRASLALCNLDRSIRRHIPGVDRSSNREERP